MKLTRKEAIELGTYKFVVGDYVSTPLGRIGKVIKTLTCGKIRVDYLESNSVDLDPGLLKIAKWDEWHDR